MSNLKPMTTTLPLTEPPRETRPVAPLPVMTPLLTKIVSDHGGPQVDVADVTQVPSAEPVARLSVLGVADALLVVRCLTFCCGLAASSPPDAALSCFPMVPPVEPACPSDDVTFATAVNEIPSAAIAVDVRHPISAPHYVVSHFAALIRFAPSAHTAATTSQDLPRLPQSVSAASLASPTLSRATIAQLVPE
jgi:hypothetical protein